MRRVATCTTRWWATVCCGLLTLYGHTFAEPLLPSVRFRVDHIGVDNGLTQGSVYFMLKDSRGFMWFGTQDGLNCYDGHRFLTYRPDDNQPGSIRGVNIFGIVEDKQGTIWVGTEEGLNRYDRWKNSFTCFYTALPKPGKRPVPSRTLPFFANEKELLYLSDDEGLVSVDIRSRTKHIIHSALKPKQEYDMQSSTIRTPAGDVWLHTSTGLLRYNLAERKRYYYFSNKPENTFGRTETVFSFHIDTENIAWVGTANGLIRFDYKAGIAHTYNRVGNNDLGPIYSLAEDPQGRIWIGTQQQGIFYFDKRARLFGAVESPPNTTQTISQYEINKIFVDNQGIIWANIDPNGVVKLVPELFSFGGLSKSFQASQGNASTQLTSYTIRGFAEFATTPADKALSKPPIWVGTESGINVLEQSSWRVLRHYLTTRPRSNLPMHNLIKRLYVDPYKRMWVGTIGGAYLFHPRDESFELLTFPKAATKQAEVAENFARDLVAISADTMLATSEEGIFQLSLATRQWQKRPEFANQNLFSFNWEPTTRRLWVGTYLNGFTCFQLPPDGSAAPWKPVITGLVGYTVLHIYNDIARKLVWLSTDRGLAALDPRTGKIQLYTERDGLANSFIYGVLPDRHNNLWMSTNRGITRFDVSTKQIKNFGLADGLQGLEYNGNALLQTQNGTLLFGGVNGFNSCQPDLYRSTHTNPAVHLYNLRVNDEPYATDAVLNEEALKLNYSQNTFSLEFAAIDYLSNTRNRYSYKLSNYDSDWVQAGEKNYVRYANVPPGNYILEVRTANKDGRWSYHIHRLAIQINPPFWRTIPFVGLVIIALSGLILFWVRRREWQIRDKQAEQLRLAFDVQEQVKRDIARDLHDEIGTRLATLKLYTSQIARFAGDEEAPRTLRNAINMLINDTISDVRDLLRELNPRTLEQYGFGTALEELLDRINATGAIEAHVSLDTSLTRLPTDTEIMLYRIVQELINNTLKHANATRIDITCRYREDRIYLTYADNGQGFSYDRVRQGLGIGNIESRVAILLGNIQWQSEQEKSTSVIISIPLPYADRKLRRSHISVRIPFS
ncbi:histidine kinase [Fibrella aestuarina]|uniref:Histidine kinase n=2 Tax=Fibrivirga algicola TaxID=2950420 RepID=A0ABX0QHS4_9BACT|nr:histidine kinase [Fibrivirga algicola]